MFEAGTSRKVGCLCGPAGEPSLGVIIPVFNEATNIKAISELVLRLSIVLELIIVDDCSTDGSWIEISSVAEDTRVKIARHDRNRGKGAAVRTALKLATAPVLVIQDADLEYSPSDLETMLYTM